MDNKLLILSVGLVIIALVSVPVVAAPQGPFEDILIIIKDIQQKVQTPPEPTSYEYYTDTIYSPNQDKDFGADQQVSNWGTSDAFVCVYQYVKKQSPWDVGPYIPWELVTSPDPCSHISAGETKHYGAFVFRQWQYRVKITADSKYVTPRGVYYSYELLSESTLMFSYLPGDFQKVEIYS